MNSRAGGSIDFQTLSGIALSGSGMIARSCSMVSMR
jgi:hypothetical protein